eukprot:m.50851 g.50851  ORF g.50851 m.50851 type:complete len:59 (-) comp12574_c1_seq1:93-269(-)
MHPCGDGLLSKDFGISHLLLLLLTLDRNGIGTPYHPKSRINETPTRETKEYDEEERKK